MWVLFWTFQSNTSKKPSLMGWTVVCNIRMTSMSLSMMITSNNLQDAKCCRPMDVKVLTHHQGSCTIKITQITQDNSVSIVPAQKTSFQDRVRTLGTVATIESWTEYYEYNSLGNYHLWEGSLSIYCCPHKHLPKPWTGAEGGGREGI